MKTENIDIQWFFAERDEFFRLLCSTHWIAERSRLDKVYSVGSLIDDLTRWAVFFCLRVSTCVRTLRPCVTDTWSGSLIWRAIAELQIKNSLVRHASSHHLCGIISSQKKDGYSHRSTRCHYSTFHSIFDSILFICLSWWRVLVLVNIDRDRFIVKNRPTGAGLLRNSSRVALEIIAWQAHIKNAKTQLLEIAKVQRISRIFVIYWY